VLGFNYHSPSGMYRTGKVLAFDAYSGHAGLGMTFAVA
jgi:hypothetical protein